ncbi:MAG: TIGR00725 family protein [Dehalococcoidia bacterium]|nr:TIGR00725 family protein [Dehalococcoidia bacterium]
MNARKILIAVIGASQASASELKNAEEVGCLIARSGAALVCGGMGGVMEAACRGANSEGGLTVGILPGDSAQAANEFVDIPVVTGIGFARNVAVVKSARAVIAVGGSYGTLSEIAHALQGGLPVIGLGTWQISRDGKHADGIVTAQTPAEAVSKALEMIGAPWIK